MSTVKARLYNFANDSAASTPISSAKVDAELDQAVAALNQKVLIASSAPSSPVDGQTWIDLSTDPPVLKIYDQTNAGWKTLSVYADFGLNSAKTAPVAADSVLINDSEASDALKEVTITNLIKAFPADTIDAITEIKSTIKSGSDATLVTGTKGTSGNLAMWNADGDAVDSTKSTADLTQSLGSWATDQEPAAGGGSATYADNTVYLAATDGFVMAIFDGSGQSAAAHNFYTDSANPPTTVRQTVWTDDGEATNVDIISISCPVKSGDYWKVVKGVGSVTIYWIPLS